MKEDKPPQIVTRETSIKDYTISIPNLRSLCLLTYLADHPHSDLTQLMKTRLYKGEHGYYMALKALRKHELISEWEVRGVRLWFTTQKGNNELDLLENFRTWSKLN